MTCISSTVDYVNLFYQPLITKGVQYLDAEESRHCYKVLRKRPGDNITVIDGKGSFYDAILTQVDPQQSSFTIIKNSVEEKRNFFIHVALAPTKNPDRVEWFAEKATEIGVDEISFIQCDHSERVKLKLDRIERIAISAMKQSMKATLPRINELTDYQDFVVAREEDHKFVAYVDSSNPDHLHALAKPGGRYCVLIGPEGDFSREELQLAIDHGYKKVSLGKSRLRTETAALVACHTLNVLNL